MFKFFLDGRLMNVTIKNISTVGIKTSAAKTPILILPPEAFSIRTSKSTKDKKPKVKKRIKKDELQISEVKITSKSKSATGAKRGRPRKPTV